MKAVLMISLAALPSLIPVAVVLAVRFPTEFGLVAFGISAHCLLLRMQWELIQEPE